jgi:uncharacterized membrane protein
MKRSWRENILTFVLVFCVTFVVTSAVFVVGYLALHSWRLP